MKKKTNKKLSSTHTKLMVCFYILLGVGLLQVYSASAIYAAENFSSSYFFFKKQALFSCLAGLWFLISLKIPRKIYLLLGLMLFLGSFVGLALTFVPGFGVTIGGATRWLNVVNGIRIEPGEFYKVGFGFFIYWLFRAKEHFKEISLFWPFVIVYLISVGLFLKQPDFGSVILMTLSTMVVVFLWSKKVFPFALVGVLATGGLAYFLTKESYRLERVMTFLNPWSDPQGKGFQTIQSFVAFKKGGFFGEGVGMSQAKYFFLPEAHTDFTLAVFAEEWGFLGVFLLLGVFMTLTFSLLKIAKASMEKDKKLSLLNYYLGFLFFFYVFVNVSVNIGLLPTKGLPLPFLSYGGSSLLALTFLMGFFQTQPD